MQSSNKYLKEALRLNDNPFFLKSNLLAQKGFSAAYLQYRVLRPLLKAYYKAFKKLYPHTPWTSQASILFFEQVLNRQMIGFEYGSGLSTLFFARKLKHLVSVEHQQEWHLHVQSLLQKEGITNVDYYLIPQNSPNEDAFPFSHYASLIKQFPDAHFDFILIDGRARVACSLHALPKLKSGGIFVLDNSERERYAPIHQLLADWPKVHTTTGLTDTTLWFKP